MEFAFDPTAFDQTVFEETQKQASLYANTVYAVSDNKGYTAVEKIIQALVRVHATTEEKHKGLEQLSKSLYDAENTDTVVNRTAKMAVHGLSLFEIPETLLETIECILAKHIGNMRMTSKFDPRVFPAVGHAGNVVCVLTDTPVVFPITSEQKSALGVDWMHDFVHGIESYFRGHIHVITLNNPETKRSNWSNIYPYKTVLEDCSQCTFGGKHWSDEVCPILSRTIHQKKDLHPVIEYAGRLPQGSDIEVVATHFGSGSYTNGYYCHTIHEKANADMLQYFKSERVNVP